MIHLNNKNIDRLDEIETKHLHRVYDAVKSRLEQEKSNSTDSKKLALYSYLLENQVLIQILTGKPESLKQIIDKVKTFSINVKDDLALSNIFFYEDYDKWGAYQLAFDLGVTSCCYCNRQYTVTVGDDKQKGTRPEFDHFFPKSIYPYLALSFYNLIPSCHTCNSNLKGNKDVALESHVHPYIEGFEESTRFSYIPSCYEDLVGLQPTSFDKSKRMQVILKPLSEDEELNKRIKGNIDLFRLEEVYSEHTDYIKDLIRLNVISNSAYIKDIAKLYDGLFDGEEELYRLIFGKYLQKEDFIKRPMSKLTRDILEGMGIFPKA